MPAAPKIAFRKIADLTPDPQNARTHSPEQVEQIAGSIRRFGWTSPILTDDLIRAGHGRRAAAQLIYDAGERIYMAPGQQHGGTVVPDQAVPIIDCTGWTEEERRAYALADNRIAERAGWDTGILRAELDALAAVEFDIASIGFDPASLAALVDEAGEGDRIADAQRTPGESGKDSDFQHTDQYAVIVRCADEAEQEQRFIRLRDEYGADNVKVVVV